MGHLARAVLAWVLVALAETLHGVLRALLVMPVVGELASRQIGVFSGSALILFIAWLVIRWIGAVRRAELLAVGGVWFGLMLGFEVGFARVLGYSWERILSDYKPTEGGLMLFGMGVILVAPLLAARWRTGAWAPR